MENNNNVEEDGEGEQDEKEQSHHQQQLAEEEEDMDPPQPPPDYDDGECEDPPPQDPTQQQYADDDETNNEPIMEEEQQPNNVHVVAAESSTNGYESGAEENASPVQTSEGDEPRVVAATADNELVPSPDEDEDPPIAPAEEDEEGEEELQPTAPPPPPPVRNPAQSSIHRPTISSSSRTSKSPPAPPAISESNSPSHFQSWLRQRDTKITQVRAARDAVANADLTFTPSINNHHNNNNNNNNAAVDVYNRLYSKRTTAPRVIPAKPAATTSTQPPNKLPPPPPSRLYDNAVRKRLERQRELEEMVQREKREREFHATSSRTVDLAVKHWKRQLDLAVGEPSELCALPPAELCELVTKRFKWHASSAWLDELCARTCSSVHENNCSLATLAQLVETALANREQDKDDAAWFIELRRLLVQSSSHITSPSTDTTTSTKKVDLDKFLLRMHLQNEAVAQHKEELRRIAEQEELNECSFQPRIDDHHNKNSTTTSAFDRLYSKANERLTKQQQVAEQQRLEKERAELAECSFSPRLNSSENTKSPPKRSNPTTTKNLWSSDVANHLHRQFVGRRLRREEGIHKDHIPEPPRTSEGTTPPPLVIRVVSNNAARGIVDIKVFGGEDPALLARSYAIEHGLSQDQVQELTSVMIKSMKDLGLKIGGKQSQQHRFSAAPHVQHGTAPDKSPVKVVGIPQTRTSSSSSAWEIHWDATMSRWFYWNRVTKASEWELPHGVDANTLKYVV